MDGCPFCRIGPSNRIESPAEERSSCASQRMQPSPYQTMSSPLSSTPPPACARYGSWPAIRPLRHRPSTPGRVPSCILPIVSGLFPVCTKLPRNTRTRSNKIKVTACMVGCCYGVIGWLSEYEPGRWDGKIFYALQIKVVSYNF
jgi:hypothetical protein